MRHSARRGRPPLRAGLALTMLTMVALSACGGGGASTSTPAARHRSDALPPAAGLPQATAAATGPLVADLGFRPESNGFSFENYGTGFHDLTPVEMRALFGDGVCASTTGGGCDLVPPAQEWMDLRNRGMAGGHCQGMSVTALLFFKGQLKPSDYGKESVPALALPGNDALQRRIAESYAFQALPSVASATVHGTPVQVLDALTQALHDRGPLTFGLGIYKPGRTGGHEITPFAVIDRGDGRAGIQVYDNNYPKTTRELVIDRSADTWSYMASTSPGDDSGNYAGGADTNTLEIDPIEPGTGLQPCPFCGDVSPAARSTASRTSVTAAGPPMEQISLDGDPDNHAHLLIIDASGHRLGYAGGTFVNEIPGAAADFPRQDRVWNESEEPVYNLPTGSALTITVDGGAMTSTDGESVSMIGPGVDLNVDGLEMDAGRRDTLTISADRSGIGLTAGGHESPVVQVGADFGDTANAFTLAPGVLDAGATMDTRLLPDALSMSAPSALSVDVGMLRQDTSGDARFKHSGVSVPAGGEATLQYAGWRHHGESIPLVTRNAGGEKRSELPDQG